MSNRRIASHEVISDNGQHISPGVVEIDNNGVVVATYPLIGETAHTVWIGGRIEIKHDDNGLPRAYKDNKII